LNLTRGAFLIVAHHINLEVGDMVFKPVGLDAMAQLGSLRSELIRWTTETADVLVQLPYLFIWMAGIFWGRLYARRDRERGRWVRLDNPSPESGVCGHQPDPNMRTSAGMDTAHD